MRHHKPALTDPVALELQGEPHDPWERTEAAYRTAEAVVGRGRAGADPELTQRLIGLVDEVGLSVVAELWSQRPARSLPGALWRLYLLDQWVQRQPQEVGRAFNDGAAHAEVYRVIAGVAEPPSPEDLRALTRQILAGVFEGDLGVALERAAAFCQVMAVGLTQPGGDDIPGERVRQAARMRGTADDLTACARLWRSGDLH